MNVFEKSELEKRMFASGMEAEPPEIYEQLINKGPLPELRPK